ncbi:hypothetical protein AMK31_28180 [Streptomyces sp. TSRI0107]|nr:hypothetical protein AMK31_28180 [Streptomyces sp. TSRI0107]
MKASFAVVSSAAPSGRRSAVAFGEARRSVTAVLALGDGDAADGATVGGHPFDGHRSDEYAELRAKAGVWRTGLAVLTGDGTDRVARIEKAL